MLELKSIEITYDSFTAVKGLDLTIGAGEFFTFLGPSGCGKTTTLRAIAGFVKPTKGQIEFAGSNITNLEPEYRQFGFVFQNYALFPHMDVFGNVAFGLSVKKHSKASIAEKVNRYLEMLELSAHKHKNVSMLSGGQQQRVAIARALVMEPGVLLMDEPLSNLDAKLRLTMRNELKNIQRQLGITTIYVTHDQEEALAVSDRIAVFNKGEVQQVGTPKEIYEKPANPFVYTFVGQSNRLPASRVAPLLSPGSLLSHNELFFRPEHVRISRSSSAHEKDISIPVTIAESEYNGRVVIYKCLFENAAFDAVVMNDFGHEGFEVGSHAYALVDRRAMESYTI